VKKSLKLVSAILPTLTVLAGLATHRISSQNDCNAAVDGQHYPCAVSEPTAGQCLFELRNGPLDRGPFDSSSSLISFPQRR
jgi:hypothetical protein